MHEKIEIDLNADLGEGLPSDEYIIPLVSSANIACGFHAGDTDTMKRTIELCQLNQVAIGAHPSFADRQHFGRMEMVLPLEEIEQLVLEQLHLLQNICLEMGATLRHVKPHGALYNMSARNPKLAEAIAHAVYKFNPSLVLFGLSGSHSVSEGVMAGLKTAAEVFADRTYQPDGSLTSRASAGAVMEENDSVVAQALRLATLGEVVAVNGEIISLVADTICLHGDSPHAVSFARNIHQSFTSSGIIIKPV